MADAEYIAELEAELKWLQREHVKICSSESKLREAVNELIKIAPQNNVSAAIKAALLEGEKDD